MTSEVRILALPCVTCMLYASYTGLNKSSTGHEFEARRDRLRNRDVALRPSGPFDLSSAVFGVVQLFLSQFWPPFDQKTLTTRRMLMNKLRASK